MVVGYNHAVYLVYGQAHSAGIVHRLSRKTRIDNVIPAVKLHKQR